MQKLILILCLIFPLLATSAESQNVPEYFLGTFEDEVPKVIGGTVPEMKFFISCTASSGCLVRFGSGKGEQFDKITASDTVKFAQAALAYAKNHKTVSPASPMSWQAKNLQPLLSSVAEIDSCIDLNGGGHQVPVMPKGAPALTVLCKLNQNPWDKPVVLLMGMMMANCGDLFCGYEIYPAFRQSTTTPPDVSSGSYIQPSKQGNMVFHSFSFNARNESPDAEVLDYVYGDSHWVIRPERERVALGQVFPYGGESGVMTPGDFLYVKWRNKISGQIYEDKVDLKSRLPADIQGLEVHFVIKGPQLYVYLIWPYDAKHEYPIGELKYFGKVKQVRLYPDQPK